MPNKQPDAIATLKSDHRKVEDLFEKFTSAKGDERKKALADEICRELTVHATIEEEIFYPACRGKVEADSLDEAYVEHDGAKMLIAEIESAAPGDDFFDAKVTVLSEMIKHHVKEEERRAEGLFAQARNAGLDVDALGRRLVERKQALLAEFKSKGLPPPQTRSFTGREVVRGAPVVAAAAAR